MEERRRSMPGARTPLHHGLPSASLGRCDLYKPAGAAATGDSSRASLGGRFLLSPLRAAATNSDCTTRPALQSLAHVMSQSGHDGETGMFYSFFSSPQPIGMPLM